MTGLIYVDTAEHYVREGELFATVTLARSGDISGGATLTFETTSASAETGADFAAGSGTLEFGKRVSKVIVSIAIRDDLEVEPDEQFGVNITAVDATSTLSDIHTATVTITDDDAIRAHPSADALIPAYNVSATSIGIGFRAPVAMTFIPGSDLALVAEKGGYIKVLDWVHGGRATVLLDLRERVNSNGERGLLGLVLQPDLAHQPYLYTYYTVDPPEAGNRTGGASRDGKGNRYSHLSRFTLDLTGKSPAVVPDSEVILLGGAGRSIDDISGAGAFDFTDEAYAAERASNLDASGHYKRDYIKVDSQTHVGGALAFGPDGMLYVSTGDGSSYSFADPRSLGAQDPGSLNGKVLRIDPLTGRGLGDNPYAGADLDDNAAKVWAMGFRNPYTMTFAPDGSLFSSETGWDSWEEINVITRAGNYGWPYYEGGDLGAFQPAPGYEAFPQAAEFYAKVETGALVATPAYRAFSHTEGDPGFQVGAIVGAGGIYTGDNYPSVFRNDYFFTDIVDGEIFSVDASDPAELRYVTDLGSFGPTSFTPGPDGYIYIADMVTDRILRLEIGEELAMAE